MTMDVTKLMQEGTEHTGRAFGGKSIERPQIIEFLRTNGAATPAEVSEAIGITEKLAKTRLDVMRRDKIVDWRDFNSATYYYLIEKPTDEVKPKRVKVRN